MRMEIEPRLGECAFRFDAEKPTEWIVELGTTAAGKPESRETASMSSWISGGWAGLTPGRTYFWAVHTAFGTQRGQFDVPRPYVAPPRAP